jgi:HNH endonuclease/AP2 domain
MCAGAAAGAIVEGYLVIKIEGHTYKASRLAWLYVTGAWPGAEIDHRNLNRLDNRWGNLRVATHSQNHANKRVYSNNACGFKGVSRQRRDHKWRARIQVNGNQFYLGLFDTSEAAHAAYCVAAEKYFGTYARGS